MEAIKKDGSVKEAEKLKLKFSTTFEEKKTGTQEIEADRAESNTELRKDPNFVKLERYFREPVSVLHALGVVYYGDKTSIREIADEFKIFSKVWPDAELMAHGALIIYDNAVSTGLSETYQNWVSVYGKGAPPSREIK